MAWEEVLRRESVADDTSFSLQIRGGHWDHQKYEEVFTAMKECVRDLADADEIPRWVAGVFWWLDMYIFHFQHYGDAHGHPSVENAATNFNHLIFDLFADHPRDDDGYEPVQRLSN